MTIEHVAISDPNIHEPKGIATATDGRIYVADGLGSGAWEQPDAAFLKSVGKQYGQVLTADGADTVSWDNLIWKDLIGDVTPKTSGPGAPALSSFRGNIRGFAYSVGDDGDCQFHLPHDYAMGTDLYLHIHWAHNGTAISGSFATNFYVTYAKGHDQEDFPAEIAPVITVATPDIATIPRYRHRIEEIQITDVTPSATRIDRALLEPDGLLLVHFDVATIPTITGGAPNEPFIFFVDIHYQAKQAGTLNKSPDFFV